MSRYSGRRKRAWRRMIWTAIRKNHPEGSLVVCLCGDDGHDIEQAKRTGMRVVGVDLKQDNVMQFRRRGGIAIQADVEDVLHCLEPEAVILDYLQDIDCMRLFPRLKVGATVVFNFQRGRTVTGVRIDRAEIEGVIEFVRRNGDISPKNRGLYAACLRSLIPVLYSRESILGLPGFNLHYAFAKRFAAEKPVEANNIFSYISDGTRSLTFDSVILKNMLAFQKNDRIVPIETIRRVAAAKALLTMSKNVSVTKHRNKLQVS